MKKLNKYNSRENCFNWPKWNFKRIFSRHNCPNELTWRSPETIYSSGSKIEITLILSNDRKIVTRISSKPNAVHNMFQSNQVGWSPTGNRRLSFVCSAVEAYYDALDLIADAVSRLPCMFVCFVLYIYIWFLVWFGFVFT